MSDKQEEQTPPERWSARAKTEVILRLFRGESVDTVSREMQVPAHELETWRKALKPGMEYMKSKY